MTHANGDRREVIVNADDFGRSEGINRGVIVAHAAGIVTSASLMVRWPAAQAAGEFAQHSDDLSVGLHFDLGEWAYGGGRWVSVYDVASPESTTAVEAELHAQLERFRELTGRDPTHIDSHQHVHGHDPVATVVSNTARRLDVPVRGDTPHVRSLGDFHGQTGNGEPYPEGVSVEALTALIRELPAGVTELVVHPGEGEDFESVYSTERSVEVETLTDDTVREALARERVELRSFNGLGRKGAPK
jgi:chitin disaccharide deacetylase